MGLLWPQGDGHGLGGWEVERGVGVIQGQLGLREIHYGGGAVVPGKLAGIFITRARDVVRVRELGTCCCHEATGGRLSPIQTSRHLSRQGWVVEIGREIVNVN